MYLVLLDQAAHPRGDQWSTLLLLLWSGLRGVWAPDGNGGIHDGVHIRKKDIPVSSLLTRDLPRMLTRKIGLSR